MIGTVVGVLRGGPSSEHDVSLKTGHSIIQNLPAETYTVRDIYIDKSGVWNERGKAIAPEQVLRSVDVVVVGLHGTYGEDGEVQKLLERFGVPYTGSDSFGSYIAMHKVLAKEKAREMGILTPRYAFVERGQDVGAIVGEIVRNFHPPVVVKPVASGSSVGVSLVSGYAPLVETITQLLETSPGVLIEERIIGTEATVGVLENMRDEELYALPPVEIVPPESADFFDYEVKYNGSTTEICPGRFDKKTTQELQKAAQVMHIALGLRHYSRSDFIVSKNGIYYLETNTLPGLTEQSLFPQMVGAVGMSFPDFLTHLIGLALKS